jgi:putative YphP/YqiW family bacilliredoxin
MTYYDRDAVTFMWRELEAIGVQPLTSAAEVEAALGDTAGTALVVVNSVCGCAAGNARPAVALALQHSVIPDRAVTVFAGVDIEATQRARAFMPDMQPSSPSVFLIKNGAVAHAVPRSDIEGREPEEIAGNLTAAFDKHCSRTGPSVPYETDE